MHGHDPTTHESPRTETAQRTRRRSRWVFGGFIAVVALLIALEHRAHLLGWLPWVILAACPLMHLFMHGGHGNSSTGARK